MFRIERNSFAEVLNCKICLAFLAVRKAAVIECGSVARTELDRSVVVQKRAVVFLLFSVSIGPVNEGRCIFRIELDCPVEISNGAAVLGLVGVGVASEIMSQRIVGIEPDRLVIILNCEIDLIVDLPDPTPCDVGLRVLRPPFDGELSIQNGGRSIVPA